MLRSWKLGRAFGIDIYVHWTFLLLVGFVLYTRWGTGGPDFALYSVATLLAVFGCVVLHELGHALTARYFGIPTRDITLYPIGGVARLERMSEKPWEEFWIAVAGPAVNVVIAAILLGPFLHSLRNMGYSLEGMLVLLQNDILANLFAANLLLVAFNLLPAFPMDGGRVLRALLIMPLGRLQATEFAASLGTAFALLFVVAGPFLNPVLMLVGAFLFFAGRQELALVRRRAFYRRTEPVEVLPAYEDVIDVAPVSGNASVPGFYWDSRTGAWVVWRNGRPIQSRWSE